MFNANYRVSPKVWSVDTLQLNTQVRKLLDQNDIAQSFSALKYILL